MLQAASGCVFRAFWTPSNLENRALARAAARFLEIELPAVAPQNLPQKPTKMAPKSDPGSLQRSKNVEMSR